MNDEVIVHIADIRMINFWILAHTKEIFFVIESQDKSHVILVDIAKIGIVIPCDTPEIGEMNFPNSSTNFWHCVYK
jgi:hypothetical protein